jgi:ketosteroid isomerase-like protein
VLIVSPKHLANLNFDGKKYVWNTEGAFGPILMRMKRCPNCQSIYTDESLSYCLQDGSQLVTVSDSASSADATWQMSAGRALPPTEILKPEDIPTARIEAIAPTREQPRARPTALDRDQPPATEAQAPRSNAPVVALSVVVILLLVSLAGLITWIMLRDKGQPRPGMTTSNTATSANTTTQPSPVETATAQREVQAALDAWANSIRQRNIDDHMKMYADKLDVFYNSSDVSADKIRSVRLDAFSRYSTMDLKLSKTRIDVTDSGTRAVATFDKTFDFKGDTNFSGAVESRLYLEKTGGRWRITGEKDLKTYYVNK